MTTGKRLWADGRTVAGVPRFVSCLACLGLLAGLALFDATAGQAQEVSGPRVGPAVVPTVSPAVKDLPDLPRAPDGVATHRDIPRRLPPGMSRDAQQLRMTPQPDPLAAMSPQGAADAAPAPLVSFEGLRNSDNGVDQVTPSDTIGDVGPNHYVQMVNTVFAVYSKTGVRLTTPHTINQLWASSSGLCKDRNDGDPVVVYDAKADRWLLSQFAVPSGGPYALCLAISQTPDPTGAYHLYELSTTNFPDYFKVGVWPDAAYNGYFVAANENQVGVYALDRAKMLTGAAVTPIFFEIASSNMMLPSHFMGTALPPSGSPNYFYTFQPSGQWGAASDSLSIYEFKPNFATPGSSTFAKVQDITLSHFNYTVCSYFNFNCVPQPGTAQKVDALSEWPMWRFNYRNFGGHQTLVGNFTVEVTGTLNGQAGIRWFELRKSGGAWSKYQEGTLAPDADWRWMGSLAMDRVGNIALGYSVANATSLYPSIRYATRKPTDVLGTLGQEATLLAGGGSQTGSNRWGDYSSLGVDPVDDCTFWFTTEYYSASSAFGWQTRIGSFKMPNCRKPSLVGSLFELILQ